MTPREEPYEVSSDSTDYPRPGGSDPSPRRSSGSLGGTEYQKMVADAISSSEFHDSYVGGIPIRRQGRGLHLSYESALEMLGWSGGSDGYANEYE